MIHYRTNVLFIKRSGAKFMKWSAAVHQQKRNHHGSSFKCLNSVIWKRGPVGGCDVGHLTSNRGSVWCSCLMSSQCHLLGAFRVSVLWQSIQRTLLPGSATGCQICCPSIETWILWVEPADGILILSDSNLLILWNKTGPETVVLTQICCSVLSYFPISVLLQADPDTPVMAAGDPERMNMKRCEDMGGIPYHISVVKYMVSADKW